MEQNAVALKVENMNLTDAMGFSAPAVSQSSLSRITGTVIQEVEDEMIEVQCGSHGYRYMVIKSNDLVVPPPKIFPDKK